LLTVLLYSGNQRKEIGLFIRQGGVYFLRVLLGSEAGVFKHFNNNSKNNSFDKKQDGYDEKISSDVNNAAKTSYLFGIDQCMINTQN
jgi:hypothetical protein